MPRKRKKIFVLDTNVILHDHKSIYNFEENDVIIPITVLEELDKFKRETILLTSRQESLQEFLMELLEINYSMEVYN